MSRITRKTFLRALGSAAAFGPGLTSSIASAAVVAVAAQGRSSMSNELSASRFAPHVDTRFRVSDEQGHTADLTLAKVDEVLTDPALDQFTLIFQGPGGGALMNGICRFEHATLGTMTWFISPIAGSNATRTVYQVCFCHVRDDQRRA
jgi:hypothetical protein